MRGRKHTIRTHPQVEEIKNKILSEAVPYRDIAEEYGVSLSAIKHFAVEVKNEPTNRPIATHFQNQEMPERINMHERQKLEAEAELRGKQNMDPRQLEPPKLQLSSKPEKVIEYAPAEIQYEPVIKLASDPDFKPGFQSEARMFALDMRLKAEEEQKRQANWNPLDGFYRRI